MASLEGADRSLAFTSGMAALTAVTRLVKTGERILAGDDIYGALITVLFTISILILSSSRRDVPAVGLCAAQAGHSGLLCGHDGHGRRARCAPGATVVVD